MDPKEVLKQKFSQNYKDYYSVSLFKEKKFVRKQCACGVFFWTLDAERQTCPNTTCQQYEFIGDSPTKPLDYIKTWKTIEKFFTKNGHESIPTYPVVCRWFPGLYFTVASIVAFQRTVAGKTVFEMPANPLVIPQQCLRFNDIPNVGVTGRHLTNFVMVGQHSIYDGKHGYWKDRCIELDFELLTKVFKIQEDEVVFVEDVWVGPAAFGSSLEYFVRGLELGNAVFTEFVGTPSSYSTMKNKIIDMGAGLERFTWLSQGTPTAYDAIFGTVMKKLKRLVDYDATFFSAYARRAGALNMDEVENIREAKTALAEQLGVSVEELIKKTAPLEAVYAIADHAKTLLYAATDGAIPSNVGGGYNLRVILRRALDFIEKNGFDLDLFDVCRWHAAYLKSFNPRMTECLDELRDVLAVETERYKNTKEKNRKIVASLVKQRVVDLDKMIELYESNGITPEQIRDAADKERIELQLPPSFYEVISERHSVKKTTQEPVKDTFSQFPQTAILYYQEPYVKTFSARVIAMLDTSVVLDQTAFYPESGGQASDRGTINGCHVIDVQKQGSVIVHVLDRVSFAEGDTVACVIDWDRRHQLMQHHTAVHIINGAARSVLGNHVWQAGASKTVEKATLDITHYQALNENQLERIEKKANAIIEAKKPIKKEVIERLEAERKYGIRIYQGGVIPEKYLRIITIPGVEQSFDIEACGGTHASNTADVGSLYIPSAERIQDGIVRLTIVAGAAAQRYIDDKKRLLNEIEQLLGVKGQKTISAAQKLFERWKKARKQRHTTTHVAVSGGTSLAQKFHGNVLVEVIDGDVSTLRAVASKLMLPKRTIILFGTGVKTYALVACGQESGHSAAELLQNIIGEYDGKGGGNKEMAQGIIEKDENIKEIADDLRKKLR